MEEIRDKVFEITSNILGIEKSTLRGEQYIWHDFCAVEADWIIIVSECEDEFQISISAGEMNNVETLDDFVAVIWDHIEHPEKNILAEKKPLKTSYMHKWIETIEMENEKLLNMCYGNNFRGSGRSFSDTDDIGGSIYSDIYKFSCSKDMLYQLFCFQFNDEERIKILKLSRHINSLQSRLAKVRRCASDWYIDNNKTVDTMLSKSFGGVVLRDSLQHQIRRERQCIWSGGKSAQVIINCLVRKILFLRLKHFSYI